MALEVIKVPQGAFSFLDHHKTLAFSVGLPSRVTQLPGEVHFITEVGNELSRDGDVVNSSLVFLVSFVCDLTFPVIICKQIDDIVDACDKLERAVRFSEVISQSYEMRTFQHNICTMLLNQTYLSP